jgi:glycosyltransferase involved in cell wall biosynthesis
MKILIIHNSYLHGGGEDAVVDAESRLLVERGHEVIFYRRRNDELLSRGRVGLISAGMKTVWAADACRDLKHLLSRESPDVAHFHNTVPLLSPAPYYACSEARVPVVQTLHNYRLLCPGGQFLRDGRVCELCLERFVPWPGVAHACYRDSRGATAAIATMLVTHKALGTWRKKVTIYIALSEFARQKFIQGGLPIDRILIKPNFVHPDPQQKTTEGEYALFVGRLSKEKGLWSLIEAWSRMCACIPLRIAGGGPICDELEYAVRTRNLAHISLLGPLTAAEVRKQMRGARFLVFPSIWFEGFPLTLAEAFACGLPVLCSRIGSLVEIVQDGVTGLHFEAESADDLVAKAGWAWNHATEMKQMGLAARTEYELKYTAGRNYETLMQIYRAAGVHDNLPRELSLDSGVGDDRKCTA